MGNICRSPTAEGVFRKLLAERAPELDVDIDSAGTHGFHDGAPPDPRACRAAERRGIDLKPLRARRVTERDFEEFELVLAMDEQNREFLLELCPVEHRHRIRLLLDFAPHLDWREVPDPYYGGSTGFERVLDHAAIEHLFAPGELAEVVGAIFQERRPARGAEELSALRAVIGRVGIT